MKKGLKIMIIIILILIVVALILWKIYDLRVKNNTIATINAVVVKVYEKSLSVMDIKNTKDLYSVGFTSEGNIGFKQGQEIQIYYDGMVLESYPAQLGKVGKIKIIKEKSDTQIPENVLKFFFSSRDNVNVDISQLTSKGISFTIKDANELPYSYSNSYTIFKKEKDERYPGAIWKEAEKMSDVSIKNTEDISTYNLSNITKDEHYTITEIKIDWVPLYGEFKERRI